MTAPAMMPETHYSQDGCEGYKNYLQANSELGWSTLLARLTETGPDFTLSDVKVLDSVGDGCLLV